MIVITGERDFGTTTAIYRRYTARSPAANGAAVDGARSSATGTASAATDYIWCTRSATICTTPCGTGEQITACLRLPEVAEAVDRTETAVRQLGSRARRHVRLRNRRFEPDRRQVHQITERFLAACLDGDGEALMAVPAPDVTMWADGNGHAETPRVPLHGAAAIAEYLASTAGRYPAGLVVRMHKQVELGELGGEGGLVRRSRTSQGSQGDPQKRRWPIFAARCSSCRPGVPP
ncbi:hypothetical protein [Streptomyces sp. DH10]|uniref:hypothetical protein n=1 Tax=Streptomyces sp. DH10 TaxID=3040121 RepID=UPI0024426D5E|nr:hypothetical protein [Streptomyces sp. DH10]MDG9710470.1 hypothetical protein [Streptomyces sp. DH10]